MRVLKGLVVGAVGLAVLASTAALRAAQDGSTGGRVTRVAQKKTVKKKARGKKAMADDAAAGDTGADPAEKKDAEKPAPAATAAPAGGDALIFSRDIAPILVANCGGCHITPEKKRGDYDMTTFKKLLMGGAKKGVPIVAGKPDESHLVRMIKGEEKPKMPQGARNNLSEEAITKIETWVKAGALLDPGKDPAAPMASYASSVADLRKFELAKMTPEQRDKQVETIGLDRWKKSAVKAKPEVTTGKHFLLFSNLPKTRADSALKKLDDEFEAVKGLLGEKAVDWGEKGSLFVFNDVLNYGEFVQANEQRQVEAGDTGTAQFTVPQPFVAVVDPLGGRDGVEHMASAAPKKAARPKRAKSASAGEEASTSGPERTLAGLLTEQFVIGAAARTGKPPRWVTLGLGALVASQVEPGSPYYRKIRADASDLCNQGWQSKANDALGDTDSQKSAVRAVGFALLDFIRSQNRRALGPFVAAMGDGGAKLDDALGKVLGASREDLLNGSGEFIMSKYGH